MKSILKFSSFMLSLLLLHFLTAAPAFSQTCETPPDCIVNPDLTSNGGGGDMNSSGPSTVNGWNVSHGSPSISSPAPGSPPNGIWMWSYTGKGEGIYSCYNFQPGKKYKICMWVMNTNAINLGRLNIFASNGLTGTMPTSTMVPTPTSAQLISNSFSHSGTWQQISYTFTPNAAYSQLWVYPLMAQGPQNGLQYELIVDRINVFEVPNIPPITVACGGTIVLPGPTAACVQYDWYNPAMAYIGSGSQTLPGTPSNAGVYTLSVRSGDCQERLEVNVTVEACPCPTPPDCIINPDLTANGGSGDVNSSGATTVNGWNVSHGSPSISSPAPGSPPNSIWMWSYSGDGEGVYSCYKFKRNHTYKICMWVYNTNAINLGRLNIFAATGLTGTGPTSTTVPTPTTSQLISNSYSHSPSWTQISFTYTPNADYNQLWIYPFMSQPPQNYQQYELAIDKVNVFEIPSIAPITVACGGTIVLPGPTSSCVQYDWFDPAMNYIGSGSVSIPGATPANSGPYTLRVHAGDCIEEIQVDVDVTPCEPCDGFQAEMNIEGCNPVYFTDVSFGPGYSVAWYWDFGDGTTSSLQNPVHNYAMAGVYTICLTVIRKSGDETCCKKICRDIQVCDPHQRKDGNDPKAFEWFEAAKDSRVVSFQDNVLNGRSVCDYEWNFGDGTSSKIPNATHKYMDAGTYNVELVITNCNNDKSTDLRNGSVERYARQVTVTGGKSTSKIGKVIVAPNPTTDRVRVTLDNIDIKSASVYLTDIYGKKLAVGILEAEGSFLLSLESFAPGLYMVNVVSDSGKYAAKVTKR